MMILRRIPTTLENISLAIEPNSKAYFCTDEGDQVRHVSTYTTPGKELEVRGSIIYNAETIFENNKTKLGYWDASGAPMYKGTSKLMLYAWQREFVVDDDMGLLSK